MATTTNTTSKAKKRFPGSRVLLSPAKAAAKAKAKKAEEDAENNVKPPKRRLGEVERPPAVLDEKYKGEKTYVLTEPHYRLGITYQPGEMITVTDEVPGLSWEPVDDDVEADAPPTALVNPNDASIISATPGPEGEVKVGPTTTRLEQASQGREVPGVKSENDKMAADPNAAKGEAKSKK